MNGRRHSDFVSGCSPGGSHPFLVDQTPYLKWDSSSAGGSCASGVGSSRSSRSSSTSSIASSSSSPVALGRSWPFQRPIVLGSPASIRTAAPPPPPRRPSSAETNPPYTSPYASTPYTSPQQQGVRRFFSPPKSTPATPIRTPSPPDADGEDCAQFMRDAEQQEYYFGSVAARVSPRTGVRRELLPHFEQVEELKPLPPLPPRELR